MIAPPVAPTLPYVTSLAMLPEEVKTSADFNEWLKIQPAGSLIYIGSKSIDCEEGPICIVDRSDLTFWGGNFTQSTDGSLVVKKFWAEGLDKLWPRNRSFFYCIRASRISFINTTIAGPNVAAAYLGQMYEEQAGFLLQRCWDISITSPKVSGTFGDAVSLAHENANRLPCERVRISDIIASSIGRNLVSVVSAIDVDVHGGQVSKTGRSCLNIEPAVAANECRRIRMRNIAAAGVNGALLANQGGSNLVSDIHFQDIRIMDKPIVISMKGRTDRPARRENYLIERISSGGSAIANGYAMRISDIDGVTVKDIWQRAAGYLQSSSGAVVYRGVGARFENVNTLTLERLEFPKGKSAANTGDVTPYEIVNCSNVTIS